jgi:hypothetical protein
MNLTMPLTVPWKPVLKIIGCFKFNGEGNGQGAYFTSQIRILLPAMFILFLYLHLPISITGPI